MSMGGGGGSQTSTGTTYTTNIPEYAKPYVETMLGATQRQLFEGNTDEGGNFNITGFKPYQPYSRDPSDYIAGFSPLQQQAFSGIGSLTPAQQIGQGSALAGTSALGGLDIAGQANPYGFQQQVGGYMNPYLQGVLAPQLAEANRQYDIGATRQQGAATQAGAFGGSREAIMAAENERGRQAALQGIIGQGYNQAFNQAQQQYNQSMQTRLAGLGMAGQAAGTLGQLGQTQYGQQTGIIGLQGQMGAQQQALEQQKINQSIQDYANAQQYPLMQLGVMSNMLRGLPMQAATSNQYVAAPNALTQGIGAAGAAASIYNATKAEGGVIKSMAKGGITSVPSYDVGGEVKDQLASMGVEELERQARESSSPTIREMAKELLREKQMAQAPQGVGPVGPMGVDYQAPQMAGGGIIAFQSGGEAAYKLPKEEMPDYGLIADQQDQSDAERSRLLMAEQMARQKAGRPMLESAGTSLVNLPTDQSPVAPMPQFAGPTANLQTELYKQNKLAERSVNELAAEKEAAAGPDVGAQEFRKQIMDERANAKDEAQRQRWMRAAQFFAKWGSTPGPVLVAGMNALNEKLPDIISDEQTYKKAKRDVDKTIFDLDRAVRLEKMGYRKEAQDDINKAAERAMHINQYLGSYLSAENVANINKSSHIEVAKLHGSVQRDIKAMEAERRKFDKEEASDLKKQSQLKDALALQANTETKITNLMKNEDYQKLVRDASADPKKYPKLATTIKEAEKELKKRNEDFERLRKDTQDLVDYHRDRSGFNKAKEDKEGNDPLKVR